MAKKLRIRVGGRLYQVEIPNPAKTPMTVVVDGVTYEVEVEREERLAVTKEAKPEAAPPLERPAQAQTQVRGKITAPMPGKIIGIKVNVGDRVAYGQEVLILEAMKMEQSIRAAEEGVVKAIKVTVGQSVPYGAVLVELE